MLPRRRCERFNCVLARPHKSIQIAFHVLFRISQLGGNCSQLIETYAAYSYPCNFKGSYGVDFRRFFAEVG